MNMILLHLTRAMRSFTTNEVVTCNVLLVFFLKDKQLSSESKGWELSYSAEGKKRSKSD